MYIDENDSRTPRERVDDTFLRRMLGETGRQTPPVSDGGFRSAERGGTPCAPSVTPDTRCLMNFPLGMVYCPIQEWKDAYDVETALSRGTLFRQLDKPWEVGAPSGKGGCRCE